MKAASVRLAPIRKRYTEVAVMCDGQRHAVAEYLRRVADAIETGATAGNTGVANKARGRWITVC